MNTAKMIFLWMAIISSAVVGQTNNKEAEAVKQHIIALDKAGWESWKNNDASWYRVNTTEEFLSINADGISNKEQVIQSTLKDCNVKSIALDNFHVELLNESTVLLTYTAVQVGECGGVPLPRDIRVAVNYVKRGERWLEALYMETPISIKK
jgi:hypothetical protein